MKSRYVYTIFFIIALLGFSLTAAAQSSVELESLEIRLWPEFDDPRLLVIIDGKLTQVGDTIRIPLPPGATIHAVASADEGGNLMDNPWEASATADGGSIVSLAPVGELFRLEYYVPLASSGEQREVDFIFPAGFITAADASVEILVPPNGTDISNDPVPESQVTTPSGGILLSRSLGSITSDEDITNRLQYANPSGALAVPEGQNLQAATPPPSASSAAVTGEGENGLLSDPVVIALGLLALLLLGGGAFMLWRTRQQQVVQPTASPPMSASRRKRQRRVTEPAAPIGTDRFCRQCGTEFKQGDRFCRQCGAKRANS